MYHADTLIRKLRHLNEVFQICKKKEINITVQDRINYQNRIHRVNERLSNFHSSCKMTDKDILQENEYIEKAYYIAEKIFCRRNCSFSTIEKLADILKEITMEKREKKTRKIFKS